MAKLALFFGLCKCFCDFFCCYLNFFVFEGVLWGKMRERRCKGSRGEGIKREWSPGCGLHSVLFHSNARVALVGGVRFYIDELTAFLTGREDNDSIDEGEQGVVLAHADVEARVVLSAALTLDDSAGFALRSTENFNAKAFAF